MMQQRKFKLDMKPEGMDLTIKPDKNDIVVNKNTASIFIGTNFEAMLKNAGIMTVVVTGIATEFGVESSARDAVSSFDKDAHERSLENMKKMFPVMPVNEIIEKLNLAKNE